MVYSSVTFNAARVKAEGIKKLATGCYIAIGRGNSDWDDIVTQTKTFSNNTFSTTTNIIFKELRSSDDETTYTKNLDYSVNELSGVITRLPDGNIPNNATVNVDYTVPGRFNSYSTELFDEIGRKKANIDYVEEDENGTIELDALKYNISTTPTNLIYIRTTFSVAEAAGENVRETGLFFNTVPAGVSHSLEDSFEDAQLSVAPNIRDVVIKTTDEVTTFVEGTDYIVNYSLGIITRLTSGAIGSQTVLISYKQDPNSYIDAEDVNDPGVLYAGITSAVQDRDSRGNWTNTFLIALTE